MANWNICYNWMMDNEDASRSYECFPDAPGKWLINSQGDQVWDGAYAISGINSVSYPAQFNTIKGLLRKKRGPAIEQFYKVYFWNYWLNQINSDEVTKRVFDAEVNMGQSVGVKLLQAACNVITTSSEIPLAVDGVLGPLSIARVNQLNSIELVTTFKAKRVKYYEDIIAAHPSDEKYKAGWLARANK